MLVGDLLILDLKKIESYEGVGKDSVRGQLPRRRRGNRRRQKYIAVVAHSEGEALGPAVDQAAGNTAAQFVRRVIVVELIDYIAQIVAGDGAVELPGPDLLAPRPIQRIQWTRNFQRTPHTVP